MRDIIAEFGAMDYKSRRFELRSVPVHIVIGRLLRANKLRCLQRSLSNGQLILRNVSHGKQIVGVVKRLLTTVHS